MSRGAVLDIEGREVPIANVAKGLGFRNVEAFQEWRRRHDDPRTLDSLLADVCNLKQDVLELSARLSATGMERIGI